MTDDAVLGRAIGALRRHTDQGWILVRENALLKALSAFRPSAPVRGRTDTPAGPVDYYVAADVLVSALRETLAAVPHVGPLAITCSTDDHDRLTSVVVEIVAAFDEPLLPLAATARKAAAARLTALLGDLAPHADAIAIDVAITDVTEETSDPWS